MRVSEFYRRDYKVTELVNRGGQKSDRLSATSNQTSRRASDYILLISGVGTDLG
jgi:hypothetical protein